MHTGLEETKDWNRVATFYAERAAGGVGLMVTGGMAPNREGGVFPGAGGAVEVAKASLLFAAFHHVNEVLRAGRDVGWCSASLRRPGLSRWKPELRFFGYDWLDFTHEKF